MRSFFAIDIACNESLNRFESSHTSTKTAFLCAHEYSCMGARMVRNRVIGYNARSCLVAKRNPFVPNYEYECVENAHRFEIWQPVGEAAPLCPECNSVVKKVFHVPRVIFKGSGFYVTDLRSEKEAGGKKSDAKSNENAGSSSADAATAATASDASATSPSALKDALTSGASSSAAASTTSSAASGSASSAPDKSSSSK